jgi:uncharacterized protein (TIGR02118 family)
MAEGQSVHRSPAGQLKLTVLYGHPSDPAAFEAYYAQTHMPLVHKIPGLGRIEQARAVGTPDGSQPAFYRMFEFWFDNPEHMQRVLDSPEAQAAVADLANFASGGATTLVAQVDG